MDVISEAEMALAMKKVGVPWVVFQFTAVILNIKTTNISLAFRLLTPTHRPRQVIIREILLPYVPSTVPNTNPIGSGGVLEPYHQRHVHSAMHPDTSEIQLGKQPIFLTAYSALVL